jgi:hypothetical protein
VGGFDSELQLTHTECTVECGVRLMSKLGQCTSARKGEICSKMGGNVN